MSLSHVTKTLPVVLLFVLGLSACGDKPEAKAEASGSAKATATSKSSSAPAATATASAKKDDSGW